MNREHTVLLAIFASTVGAQLLTATSWNDMMSPTWIGTTLVQFGTLLRAFYTEKAGS